MKAEFPKVDSGPRNWTAPGVDGKLGGPEYYEGRGPDVLTPPSWTTPEELEALKKKHTCIGCQSAGEPDGETHADHFTGHGPTCPKCVRQLAINKTTAVDSLLTGCAPENRLHRSTVVPSQRQSVLC
jgi:hypothetical protein